MKQTKLAAGRRSFIKSGITGLAGAALLPGNAQAQAKAKKEKKFIYRTLGKTAIKLPIVSIGAVSYDPGIYRLALDSGIRHIDTSSDYANGNHERMLGKALQGRPRDSFVIATSFATYRFQDRDKKVFKANIPIQPLIDSFEGSLKRLGVEHIDIYYLAWMCSKETTLFEPYIEVLQKFKQQGKIRFIGVTTHENEPEVLRAVAASKIYDAVLTVYNFRQTHRDEVKKAIAEAALAGIGIVAMKTQAGASWDRQAASQVNMSAALKWVLQDENIHTAVPGITSYDQLQTDLAIMENLALSEAEKTDLEKMERLPYRFSGVFCQQCQQCISQCPQRLDIPTLMRSYMYAYGYRNMAKAKEALSQVDFSRFSCNDCTICQVRCAQGLNVRSQALDITRLRDMPDHFLV